MLLRTQNTPTNFWAFFCPHLKVVSDYQSTIISSCRQHWKRLYRAWKMIELEFRQKLTSSSSYQAILFLTDLVIFQLWIYAGAMSKVRTDKNTFIYENKQPMIFNANWELVNLKEFSPGQSQLASKTSERLPNDASSGFEKSMLSLIHSWSTVAGIGCSAGVANLWCTNNLSSTMFMYHFMSFLIIKNTVAGRSVVVWVCDAPQRG